MNDFTPDELDGIRSAAEALERYARSSEDVTPRAGLAAGILAAIADEPSPAPVTAMGAAARAGRLDRVLTAVRDAWTVAWTGGRPAGVRLSSALAVGILVAVLGGGGGFVGAAAWNAANPPSQVPAPTPVPARPTPTPALTATPSAPPDATPAPPSPSASPSPRPTATPGPSPRPTPRPTPHPTAKPTPRPTMRPTAMPTHHPEPTMTHHPEPSHHGGG